MTMEGGGGSGVLYRVQNPTTPKIIRTTTIKTSATNSNPAIVIAYPKGGEIWHVGETVTIKWTSTNLPKTAQLNISIVFPIVGESIGLPINGTNTVSNTGSYDWTIPKSISGYSIIGTKDEIDIDNINVPNNNGINVTYNSGYLTITN
jgi:FtsP/CotA-like multicopper oxidase with cupredoxin domain